MLFRSEVILIFGTGNVVHNLGVMQRGGSVGYDWAARFNTFARDALTTRHDRALVDFASQGRDAQLAIPTPEHYLPLLYVLGAAGTDAVTIENDGLEMGSISMLSASFGAAQASAVSHSTAA